MQSVLDFFGGVDACYVRNLGFSVQHRKTAGRVFSAHHNEDYVSKVLRRMISTRFFSCYIILKLLITIVLIVIVTSNNSYCRCASAVKHMLPHCGF